MNVYVCMCVCVCSNQTDCVPDCSYVPCTWLRSSAFSRTLAAPCSTSSGCCTPSTTMTTEQHRLSLPMLSLRHSPDVNASDQLARDAFVQRVPKPGRTTVNVLRFALSGPEAGARGAAVHVDRVGVDGQGRAAAASSSADSGPGLFTPYAGPPLPMRM